MRYGILIGILILLSACDAFDVLDERLVESFVQERISADTTVDAVGTLQYEIILDSSALSNVRGFTVDELREISLPSYSLQIDLQESTFATEYSIEIGIDSQVLFAETYRLEDLEMVEVDLSSALELPLVSYLETYIARGEVGRIFTKVSPNSQGAVYTCQIAHESLIYMSVRSCEQVPAGSSLESCP